MKKLLFLFYSILLISCSSNKKLKDGVYVSSNSVFEDYYIIDNDGTRFKLFYYSQEVKGEIYQHNNINIIKTDSTYFYKNLEIDYEVSGDGNENEHLLVEIDKDDYDFFFKKHPRISLYFIGFLDGKYTILKKLSAGENSITSDRIKNKIYEFKLVGIYNSCYNSFDECDLMGVAFKTRTYNLLHTYWNPKLEINLNSIVNKKLSQERFIKEIDKILNKHEFIVDNKKYVRFKTLAAFKGHSDESQFYNN